VKVDLYRDETEGLADPELECEINCLSFCNIKTTGENRSYKKA